MTASALAPPPLRPLARASTAVSAVIAGLAVLRSTTHHTLWLILPMHPTPPLLRSLPAATRKPAQPPHKQRFCTGILIQSNRPHKKSATSACRWEARSTSCRTLTVGRWCKRFCSGTAIASAAAVVLSSCWKIRHWAKGTVEMKRAAWARTNCMACAYCIPGWSRRPFRTQSARTPWS